MRFVGASPFGHSACGFVLLVSAVLASPNGEGVVGQTPREVLWL